MKRDTGTTGVILAAAVLLILACGSTAPRTLNLYATDTPTITVTPTLTATATRTATPLPSPTATPRYPYAAQIIGSYYCREKPFGVVIVYFTGGEQVKVITEESGWAHVIYAKQDCWVVSAALK